MLRSRISSLVRHVAGLGVRQGVAVLTLGALVLALAGPLLGPGIGADPTYCCRAGRCCCDSGKASPDHLDLKTACRCARPDGTSVAFSIPQALLAPEPELLDPEVAERFAPRPAPRPRDGETAPPDRPPRLSRIT